MKIIRNLFNILLITLLFTSSVACGTGPNKDSNINQGQQSQPEVKILEPMPVRFVLSTATP